MAFNSEILSEILSARAIPFSALPERLGISPKKFNEEIARDPEPKQGFLEKLAKSLAVPSFVFYMEAPPPLQDVLPDFRSDNPRALAKNPATLRSIQMAKAIQRIAHDAKISPVGELPHITTEDDVGEAALLCRKHFGIQIEDQINVADARTFYNFCRAKIESAGIFVIQDNFPSEDGSGFCLADDFYPVIAINTKNQTRGRRLFTLIHELCHILLGKSGISDPFISENKIERFCNRFASQFLVPDNYIEALLKGRSFPRHPDPADVARASRLLKISQQATVIRLENAKIFSSGSHDQWLLAVHNSGNPDFSEKGFGSGEPPPQEKVKLARYGLTFAFAMDQAISNGTISEIDLYRATGLKPKYIQDYFQHAREVALDQFEEFEYGDE